MTDLKKSDQKESGKKKTFAYLSDLPFEEWTYEDHQTLDELLISARAKTIRSGVEYSKSLGETMESLSEAARKTAKQFEVFRQNILKE